jgi:hypothetical protein
MELTDGTWHLDLHDIGNDDHVVVLAATKPSARASSPPR